jgi:hypothetical protein
MADGANFLNTSEAATTHPRLTCRRPVWLWGAATFAIGAGWPLLFLSREGGFAQLAAVSVGSALLIAFASLAIAYRIGRPPRLRRHVVIYVLVATSLVALIAPFVYLGLLRMFPVPEGAPAGSDFQIAGIKAEMAWAVAPLSLAVGAPAALLAGLAYALIGFRKPAGIPRDVLAARRTPQIPGNA